MFKLKKFKGWLPVPVLPAAQVAATSYAQQLAYLEWYVDYLAGIIGNAQDIADKVTELTPDVTDEQYPSAKAVQDKLAVLAGAISTLSGIVSEMPIIRVNRPLAGTEDPLTALEYNGTNYKVGGDLKGGTFSTTAGTPASSWSPDFENSIINTAGSALSLDTGKVKIGAGVNHVLVQATLAMVSVPAANYALYITKNGSQILGTVGGCDVSTINTNSVNTIPQIVAVEEGDLLSVTASTSAGTYSGYATVYINVTVMD